MIRIALILAPLALVACGGGNYCKRTASIAEDCGQTIADEDLDTCEEAISGCNGDDKKLLDESLDCTIDLGLFDCNDEEPTSTTGTSTGFEDLAAIMACYSPLVSLSAECQESMSVFSSTDSTMSTMTMR